MTEYEEARLLANKVLDRFNCDPDDDLCVLARQLLRADERAAALAKALGSAKVTLDGIAAADWKAWEELGTIEEFETWAKSRAMFESRKITEAIKNEVL
jgi:hypothetical protein